MPLKEKTCTYCGKMFFYEGRDATLIDSQPVGQAYNRGQCPTCIDPNAVPQCTYLKATMISGYKTYLYKEELYELVFDADTLKDMMFEQFPRTKEIWNATTFRTFTIFPGTPFQKEQFTLGISIERKVRRKWGIKIFHRRIVTCNRCQKETNCSKFAALCYYFGFLEKICFLCDNHKIPRVGSGHFTVRHTGGVPREDSMRAKAKALNVSVNDLRRGITQSEPVLPNGSVVNGLEIVGTYFDERKNHYYPCYLLLCKKCGNRFGIEQRKVETIFHKC